MNTLRDARPSVESGDVFNGGEAKAREQAIAAWNRRAPASVPEDVAGVVERLRGYRPANEWGDPVQHTICDEAASALARVAKERDEARATLDEVCLSSRQEWQRATSAEAKLAEARKVIERYESGLNTLATTFYKDDQHQDYAKHVLDIRNLEPRHD